MMLQKGAVAIIGYSDLLLYSTLIHSLKMFLNISSEKNFPEKFLQKKVLLKSPI